MHWGTFQLTDEGRDEPVHALSRALAEAHTPDRAFEHAHEPHADPAGLAIWRGVSETPGAGLQAMDAQGRRWRLGSVAWAVEEAGPDTGAVNGHGVVLSCMGRPVATFSFEEFMRGGAQDAVSRLAGAGLRLALLSGDSAGRANVLAQRLGLQECHAGLSPEDKLSLLRQAQARGLKCAMVGDGLNDAPVLAAADVSVAMGHGALAAREGADAVIVSGRLDALAELHHTAHRTMAIVRQNLSWAVAYNAICIPLALAGWLPPWHWPLAAQRPARPKPRRCRSTLRRKSTASLLPAASVTTAWAPQVRASRPATFACM
jgi:Cu2+-exporting ATPase